MLQSVRRWPVQGATGYILGMPPLTGKMTGVVDESVPIVLAIHLFVSLCQTVSVYSMSIDTHLRRNNGNLVIEFPIFVDRDISLAVIYRMPVELNRNFIDKLLSVAHWQVCPPWMSPVFRSALPASVQGPSAPLGQLYDSERIRRLCEKLI